VTFQDLIGVVEAVKTVQSLKARRRKIPDWQNITFFGKHDAWKYVEKPDDRLCDVCRRHATKLVWFGDVLRYFFPYLEIMDENNIRVRAHMPRDDNCRCVLVRLAHEEEA